MTAPQPSVLFTGAYLKGNYNPGVPGGPSVFDTLANPPASGVSAQAAAQEITTALGTVDPPAKIVALRSSNRDYMKDFYDDIGIYSP